MLASVVRELLAADGCEPFCQQHGDGFTNALHILVVAALRNEKRRERGKGRGETKRKGCKGSRSSPRKVSGLLIGRTIRVAPAHLWGMRRGQQVQPEIGVWPID